MKKREKILIELKNLYRTKEVSLDHMRLFVENEQQKRVILSEKPFECFLMDINYLKDFLSHYLESDSPITKRFQLIVYNKKHYLTIDILWGKHEKKCLLLDAANDPRMMPASFALNFFPFDQIFVATSTINVNGKSNNLQKDSYSCPTFALDHAIQLSKIDIYGVLGKLDGKNFHENVYTVNWEKLPIKLIWNAQSLEFLDRYLAENEKKLSQDELVEYKEYLSKNIRENLQGKKMNVAIDNIFCFLIKNTILFVNHLKENQIISILEDRTYIPPIKIKKTVDANASSSQSFFQPLSSVNMEGIDGIAALNLGKN